MSLAAPPDLPPPTGAPLDGEVAPGVRAQRRAARLAARRERLGFRAPEPARRWREAASTLGRMRPARWGVRTRITLSFSLGALVLSALLAGTTYVVTRQTLLVQREGAVVAQARVNAAYVRSQLRSEPEVNTVLSGLPLPTGSEPLVVRSGNTFALSGQFGIEAIPEALRSWVADGRAAHMRYVRFGEPFVAVGIPFPGTGDAYYEVASLADLESTLRTLGFALVGAAALTTVIGVFFGRAVARRTVRPLAEAARAAEAIAGGRLDTRLDPADDRDLQVLSTAFNHMAQALEERIARDARFASDVSHELRSPLMTLAASVEVMQSRRDEMPERAQAALDLLVDDLARFQQLVEDLLEISRYDAGSVRLVVDEVDAAEFVRQALTFSSDPDVPVLVDPRAEGVLLRIDKRRIAQVVANLIDNARAYAGGASAVKVEVPPGEPDPPGSVRIAVEDRGPGVPDDERELIFQRFARGSNAGRRGRGEGTGLGLALVGEHVRLHGGSVWVEPRADGGDGARFVVTLPAVVR